MELDPNKAQREAFLRFAGTARFVYNWGLARRTEAYREQGIRLNSFSLGAELRSIIDERFPWMREVPSRVREGALRNLDRAFQHFFRRIKEGRKGRAAGYPRFKSRNRGIGGFWNYGCRVEADRVRVSRVGSVRLKERGRLPLGLTKGATIVERAGRWFITVPVEEEIRVPENRGSAVGVDLGIKSLAVTSDGEVFDNPRCLNSRLRKLRRLSRQHSRRQKGGQNRRKSARRLAVLHYRIACARRDALHRVTTDLAKNHGLVAVEDLNVRGMMKNHRLARAISDVGFAEFRRQLEYKCQWYGSRLVVIDRFYPSSKRCSICGDVKSELALSERVFRCESCGMVMDRDLNAARNILVAANPVETQNACGEGSAGREMSDPVKLPSVNQELLRVVG